ncbi:MAG: hypothetical protein ABIP39_01240, partial [Polyangiaceae bacterium]
MTGSLAVAINPSDLFDVPITNDRSIELEAERLSALLREVDAETRRAASVPSGKVRPLRDAGEAPDAALRDLHPALWRSRLDLDRTRLGYYSLPAARRDELLVGHAKRQAAAAPAP